MTCELCLEEPAVARHTVTTLEGVVLDMNVICQRCLDGLELAGFVTLAKPKPAAGKE